MTFGFPPRGRWKQTGPGFEDDFVRPLRRARIRLDDFEVETRYVKPPQHGVLWIADDLEGWWEPADDATATVAAPSGDGVLLLSPRFGARTIVLSTWVQAAPGEYYLIDELLDKVSRLRNSVLTVDEPHAGLSREADVRLLGVRTSRRDAARADVTLTLQADDPLRYGAGSQALKSGRNVLLNPGDAVAFPVLELKGPTTAFTITHDGGVFSYPDLTSGQTRIIDCRNGEASVKASGARRWNMSGAWPRVDVGGAEWTISGLGSGATLTARRFQAWT